MLLNHFADSLKTVLEKRNLLISMDFSKYRITALQRIQMDSALRACSHCLSVHPGLYSILHMLSTHDQFCSFESANICRDCLCTVVTLLACWLSFIISAIIGSSSTRDCTTLLKLGVEMVLLLHHAGRSLVSGVCGEINRFCSH